EGAARALARALADARVNADEVGYVNAHGTSSVESDVSETLAMKQVFNGRANDLWISSTKSMNGHMLGAAAPFETIVTALSLQRGVVPPTINLDQPDPRCDLDYVPRAARDSEHRIAASNSFGFGGQNASIVLRAIN